MRFGKYEVWHMYPYPELEIENITERFVEIKRYIDNGDINTAIFLIEDFQLSLNRMTEVMKNWRDTKKKLKIIGGPMIGSYDR